LGKNDLVEDGLEEMEGILKRGEVGRLALCNGSMPYIVPLNFLYHERKIVFHCAWEGKKLDLIAENPNCCFEVDEFMGDVNYHYKTRCHLDYDSVLAFGKARMIVPHNRLFRLNTETFSPGLMLRA
jgi:nitroimidazol reductase NimA-like FMN-containing flavoprotein (pyridoxamine 5'-phosphate oxidase superfamily)